MTTALQERPKNILKKDNDGRWYSIAPGMVDTFININEILQNEEMFSPAWNQATDDLNDMFGDCLKEN